MTSVDERLTRGEFLSRLARAFGAFVIAGTGVGSGGAVHASGAHEHVPTRRRGFEHPEPRDGISSEHVLAESELPDKDDVRDAYVAARASPEIFDGLYCACRCRDKLHHRSLLSCFESRQPTGCMGCREEAILVGRLVRKGKTLAEIREAVDEEYGE